MKYFLYIVLFLCWTSTYSQINLDSGLVVCYDLGGSANDLSGNGNHGQLFNGQPAVDQYNNTNGATAFDGNSTYIELPGDFDFPERTINFWFNFDKSGGYGQLYSSNHDSLKYGFTSIMVIRVDPMSEVRITIGNQTYVISEWITPNRWEMLTVAISTDSALAKYYLNGISFMSLNLDTTYYNGIRHQNALIGCLIDSGNSVSHFPGKIDHFRIYDRALSGQEISQLYSSKGCTAWASINDSPESNNIELFPNPTTGELHFSGIERGSANVELIQLNGRIVYQKQMIIKEMNKIDFADQPNGAYFLRVTQGNKTYTRKIIVKEQ